tara:strand:- start:1344 stop:1949 length:606 start_codon:yes stop_codon:yes gene_type:complete
MVQALQVLTELDAVNLMLSAIGESPVNTIENSGLADVVSAVNTLRNVSRQVQQRGWKWNTLKNYSLSPTAPLPGTVPLPVNTLKVDVTRKNGAHLLKDYINEGGQLYDIENNTNQFSENIDVDIVLLKDFILLPSPARDYIAARAAREYQQATIGSAQLASFEGISEADALRNLNAMETQNSDTNIFRGSYSMRSIFRNRR